MKKYSDYSTSDFLKDPQFIQWQLLKTESQNEYWNNLTNSYPQLMPQIEEAVLLFQQGVKINDYKVDESEIDTLLSDLYERIDSKKSKNIFYRRLAIASVAASFALLFISGWYILNQNRVDKSISIAKIEQTADLASVDVKEITLISGDSIIALVNNTEIQYNADGTATINNAGTDEQNREVCQVTYNELIVPKGRHTSITFSDGTKMWVNSGSKVRYPASFAGDKREIFVAGEVFLDVTKDTSRPFYVNTTDFTVKVLGTQLNVSVFKEDESQSVVLVEGAVEVNVGTQKIELKPSEMMTLDDHALDVKTVNVIDYVAWKNGWLQLNSMTLNDLLVKLSRYYDREISCDPAIAHLKCSGKLILFDDIETVLNVVQKNLKIDYTIDTENNIMFNPKNNKQ